MHHLGFTIVIKCVSCAGGKVLILQKSQLSKNYWFWCGYGCIKRHKTENIVLILMKFKILVVKILLKHEINKVL